GYTEAHYSLGNVLRDLKRLDEAADAYETALAAQPDFAAAQFELARIRWRQGQVAAAEQLLRDLLQCTPDDLAAREMLAEVLRLTDRSAEARATYEAILAEQPDHPAARAWLLQLKSMACDWRDRDAEVARLMRVTEHQIAAGRRTGLSAFYAFGFPFARK